MKKLFLFVLSIIISNAFAQDKTTEMSLASSNSNITGVQKIEGKGVLFASCSFPSRTMPSFKQQSNVILVDENLNVVWNKTYETPVDYYPTMLSSANSKGAYSFYYKNGSDLVAKRYTWDGTESDIVINGIDKMIAVSSPVPNASFVDKDVLYCMIRYLENKIIKTYIYTVDFETKKVTVLQNNLPDSKETKFCQGWRYMGNGDGKIYFKSMDIANVSRDTDINTNVAIIDYNGKLISANNIKVDCAPVVPFMVYNYQENDGVSFKGDNTASAENDIYKDQIIYYSSSMKLSPDKKSVYMYSLYKDVGGLGHDLSGFLVAKYSLEGKKIWQKNYPFKDNIEVSKGVVHHASQTYLNVYFYISDDDKTVNFHFGKFNSKTVYHGVASATDGKLIDFLTTESIVSFNSTVTVTSKDYDQGLYEILNTKKDAPSAKTVGKYFYVYDATPSGGKTIKLSRYSVK